MTANKENLTAIKDMLIAIKDMRINKDFVHSLCSSLNGFEFSHELLHKAYMYSNGKLFIFFPHFKKQKIFVYSVFKKYENIMDIEKILNTSHLVSIYDFIYNPSKIPLYGILKDINLKNMPNSYDILKEAAILGNSSVLNIPQHPYSNKVKDFKERYLEFLIYYCLFLTDELSAMQLAFIEKTAIDFSISSFQIKEYFRISLSAAQADRQEKIQNFLTVYKCGSEEQIKKDCLRLVEFMNKNSKTVSIFKNQLTEGYFDKQLFLSNKKEKDTLLEYHIEN